VRDGFVGEAAQVRAGSEIQQGLLDAGDPGPAKLGGAALTVESAHVSVDEHDGHVAIG
jgi:hypothetical protein